MAVINGKDTNVTGISILDYLKNNGYNYQHVVVEQNLNIISRENYEHTMINQNDNIEILNFVGGG